MTRWFQRPTTQLLRRSSWLGLLLLAPALTWAQPLAPEQELAGVRGYYAAGRYTEALARAQEAMALSNFDDAQRAELHKLSGLSAFNLGNDASADNHFKQLLLIEPDHVLDPFAVPPPAIRFFEQVRKKYSDGIALAKLQLAQKLERERAEAQQLRAQQKSSLIPRRVLEKRSWLVSLIPFGAGQFQQGRTGFGIAFAASQALLAGTSIASFWMLQSLYATDVVTVNGLLGSSGSLTLRLRGIPANRMDRARALSALNWSTATGFFVLWGVGALEALLHHRGQVWHEPAATSGAATSSLRPQFSWTPSGGFSAGIACSF